MTKQTKAWQQVTKFTYAFGDGIVALLPRKPVPIQREGQWVRDVPTPGEVYARGNVKHWTCKASGQEFDSYIWFKAAYEKNPTRPEQKPIAFDVHPRVWAKQNPLRQQTVMPSLTKAQRAIASAPVEKLA